jgi:hypothetical protein
MKAKRFFE